MMLSPEPFLTLITKPWSVYKKHITTVIDDGAVNDTKVLEYWRNQLFISAMAAALPLSLLALIPSIIIELRSGFRDIVVLDIAVFCVLSILVLTPKISMQARKIGVGILIGLFAVLLLGIMGSFNMGCIYLFALSIFIVLQYSGRVAFAGVIVNLIICIAFAFVINYGLFPLPITRTITYDQWILYSSNFMFLDLILVALTQQLLTGLEQTIIRKSSLYQRLEQELLLNTQGNMRLTQSEEHYKTLFSQSPLAICIYDQETLKFLQVNEAATRTYNYTEEEFLNLDLSAIQAGTAAAALKEPGIDETILSALSNQEIALHLKKNGEPIHVELKSSDFNFRGKQARLIIATDITRKVNDMIAIRQHNEKLKQIAYMHSHVVRVPLANIMGLSNLIMEEITSESQKDLFNYLNASVNQLDQVIRDIVNTRD